METYPEIRFASTSAALVDADTWALTGNLTIKAVTRPVTIVFAHTGAATDPFGNQRIGFETGGVLVSEKVKLEFDVSAIALVADNA